MAFLSPATKSNLKYKVSLFLCRLPEESQDSSWVILEYAIVTNLPRSMVVGVGSAKVRGYTEG